MASYADTSFLVSLYTPDAHSTPATIALNQAELPFFLTSFGELELMNAIQLRIYRRELTRSQTKQAIAGLRRDIASGVYFVRPLPETVFDHALRLTRKHTHVLGTRSLDILHVASALDLRVKTFYTFDRQQAALAEKAGLQVLPLLRSA